MVLQYHISKLLLRNEVINEDRYSETRYTNLNVYYNVTYLYRWRFAKFIKQYVSTTINAVIWGSWSNWGLIIFAWYNEVNIKQKYVNIIFEHLMT